jgi:hypothetical protein
MYLAMSKEMELFLGNSREQLKNIMSGEDTASKTASTWLWQI